eukprot:gene14617-biopygen23663
MASSCSDNSCDLDAHIRALLKSDVKDIDNVLKRILQQRKEDDVCDVVLCPKADVFRSAIRAQEGFLDELKVREQHNAAAIEKARLRIEVATKVMNHLGTQLIDEQCRAKEKLDQLRDIQADSRKFADTIGKGKDELVALRRGDEEIRLEMNRIRHKTKLVGKQRSAALGKIRAHEDELVGFREGALAAEAELVEIRERSRVASSDIDVARVGFGDATARLVGARAELVDANAELERTLLSVDETRHKVVHARADGSSLEDELAKLVDTRSELANTKSELANSKSELANSKSELSGVMSELVDTRSELANTKSEFSGVMSELSDTKSELSGVMSELSDTTSELSGVMSEIDIVYSELKSVWDSKSELETTYSELKNEHGISKYELERARSELAHMNSMRAKMAVSPDQLKVVLKDVVNCDNRLTRANVLLASLYKELSDTESDIASTRIQIKAKRTLVLNSVISRAALGPDLITASFPCQDVSMAGKGGGLSGTRSSLVWEVFRVLDGLPSVRAVFLENSPALRYRGLDAICEAFETRGFSVRYGILSAADMGARHVRSRIWVLAARDKDAGMLFPYLSRTRLSSSISQSLSYPFSKLDAEMPRLVTRSPGTESRADVRSLTLQWQALGNAIVPQAARFAFAVLLTEMRHFTPREWTAHGRRVKSGFATRVFHASETAASNGYVHGNHLDARERLRINIRWVETAIMGFPKGWMVEALAELDGKTINDVEKEVCCFVVGDQRCGDSMMVIVWPYVKDDFCTCKAACNTATAHDVPAPTLVYLPRPCDLTDDMLGLEVVRASFVLKRFKNVGPNCGQVSRESMVRSTILALIQVTTNQIDEMDDVVPVKYKHGTLTYNKAVLYRELERYGGRPSGQQQHVASEMRKMGLIENSPKNAVTVFMVNLRKIRSAIYADEATKFVGTIRSDAAP